MAHLDAADVLLGFQALKNVVTRKLSKISTKAIVIN